MAENAQNESLESYDLGELLKFYESELKQKHLSHEGFGLDILRFWYKGPT